MMEFEELVKKFSKRIKYLADRSIIPSQVIDKEDIYQEMLYHLWERWRRGEFEGKSDAYIIGSCYFHLKNYLRQWTDKAKLISLNEPLGEEWVSLEELIPSQTPLFDKKVDDILFIQQMKNKELTRKEKEVTELLAQGYTLRQIAKKLNISHIRVFKIKENIAKKFKKGGYQNG